LGTVTPRDALLTKLESLTAPDKEDWTVLISGSDAYLTMTREDEGIAYAGSALLPVNTLKECANLGGGITPGRALGCVTFILPRDAEKRGALRVFAWFQSAARRQDFSLVSITSPAGTDVAIKRWEDYTKKGMRAGGH
jgi:hypothetical protein